MWTTIAVSHGRGPLTNAVGYGIWRLAVRTGRHRVLQSTGYLVVLIVPLLWIALVWAGFVVMFLSEPGSVQQASPPYADASRVATVAYATGGLAGAGAGFVAGGPLWQLLNNLSALVGLALFTFVLTYLFQVVTAVSDQRALAARIAGLGDDPVEVVGSALGEEGLGQLPSNLLSITADLSGITRKRTALPILQFFHVGDRSQSIALNIAVLDEITTILAEAGHLDPQRVADGAQRVLARLVPAGEGAGRMGEPGGNVDDPSLTALPHGRQSQLSETHRSRHHHLELPQRVRRRDLRDRSHVEVAGVVHEAEELHVRQRPFAGVDVGQVEDEGLDLHAGRLRGLRKHRCAVLGTDGPDGPEAEPEEFFDKFEGSDVAFLYQEETADGGTSRFHKFVARDAA